MVEAGFEVTGVDDSADLLAIAAASVPGCPLCELIHYDYAIPDCEAIVEIAASIDIP